MTYVKEYRNNYRDFDTTRVHNSRNNFNEEIKVKLRQTDNNEARYVGI